MTTQFYANWTGGFSRTGAGQDKTEVGLRFSLSADTPLVGFRWYRPDDTAGFKPEILRLWRVSDQVEVTRATTINDTGTSGWQTATLNDPITLTANTVYVVSGAWQAFKGWPEASQQTTSQFPAIFNTTANHRHYHSPAGEWGYPQNNDSPWPGIDVEVVGDSTSGTGGTGTGTTTGDLASWLSNDAAINSHETDGLPWLIKTELDATKTLAQGAYDVVTTTPSGGSSLVGFLTAMGPTILAAIGTFFATANDRLNGASGGGGSAFYGPEGTQVAAGVETLLGRSFTLDDLGAAVALLRERLDLSPDLADTTRWTLVDTIEGSGDALVNVQADAYFFNLTTIPSSHPHLGVAATLWVPRWGWVAPRVHAHFRQRQFTDIFPAVFTADGLFMDGLLVHALPGFDWTCECYTLDRS